MTESIRVIEAGPGLSVQDRGRWGWMRFGVSVSGALDLESQLLANRLLGNDENEAVLEFTLLGGRFVLECDEVSFVVTGGSYRITLDNRVIQPYRVTRWARGQELVISAARDAVIGYLAIAGGLDTPERFGSRATHARSGLGGMALPADATIKLRRPHCVSVRELPGGIVRDPAAAIRIVPGPQDAYFPPLAWDRLTQTVWRCGALRDRMAMRLEGGTIPHTDSFNIISDGIVPGAIQVPGDGLPTILLADGAPTGGYPKIATVISSDLAALVQRPFGAPIRFVLTTSEQAEDALFAHDASLHRLLAQMRAPVGGVAPDTETLLSQNLISGVISGGEASK